MPKELPTNEELRELALTFLAARELALVAERAVTLAMNKRDELSLSVEGIVLILASSGDDLIVEQHLVV